AKTLTEVSRKHNSKPLRLQYVQAYGSSLAVVFGIALVSWLLLSSDSVDEDSGEVHPALSAYRSRDVAIKIVATMLLPVLFGVFRGFRTPESEIQKIPEPSRYDNDDW